MATHTSEGLQERLTQLSADEAEARQDLAAATTQAQEALVSDEPADDAIDRQLRAEARLKAVLGARANVEELLPKVVEAECKQDAEKRIVGISRAAGSLDSEYGEDIERVESVVDDLIAAIERLNERYLKLATLRTERLFLVDRFEIEAPALPNVPAPADAVREALRRVQAMKVAPAGRLPASLVELPNDKKVQNLRSRIAETPTGEILERAGERASGDAVRQADRHNAHMREVRYRHDVERQAAMDRADTFLKDALADGPVLVSAIEAKAEKEGIPSRSTHNMPPISLRDARERLGVYGLVEKADASHRPAVWWTLPHLRWDTERFRTLGSLPQRRSLSGSY